MSMLICRKCGKSYKDADAVSGGGVSRCPSCGTINRIGEAGPRHRKADRKPPEAAPPRPAVPASHTDAPQGLSRPPRDGGACRTPLPQAADSASPPAAQRIGPYEVISEIGRGGMGSVLLARDTALKRNVAIKFIAADSASQREDRLRFIREARITGKLEHPGIPPVHFLARDETGREFFVMKLIEGRVLSDILRGYHSGDAAVRREFPLARLAAIFERACETIGFAHSRGVIHRDLKPANVMVGEHGEVWVLDWGVAKEIGGGENEEGNDPAGGGAQAERDGAASEGDGEGAGGAGVGLTMAGTTVGTPEYMAPEQARGEKLDERTDVFGLGALLYEILAGHPPVRGDTRHAVMCNAAMGKHVPVRRTARGRKAPPALAAIVEKCLRFEPRERYRSAAELIGDLRAFAAGDPVSAMPDTAMAKLRRFVRRHGTAAGASAAAVLALAVLIAAGAVAVARKEREAAEAATIARIKEAEAAKATMEAKARELEAAESRRKAQEAEAAREREAALRLRAELDRQKAMAAAAERAARRLKAFEPYAQAMDLISRGQLHERAAELARKALDIDPEFPEAQFALAEALRAAGLQKDAADAYMKADEMSVRVTSRHNLQAVLSASFAYDEGGYYREAERAFESAESAGRDDPLAMAGRSFRAAHRGKAAEAAKIAEEAANRAPHFWETHFALGYAKLACARYGAIEPSAALRDAVACLGKAIELAPRRAEIHCWMAQALASAADIEKGDKGKDLSRKAMEAVGRAAALEPQNGNVRIIGAQIKQRTSGDIRDAKRGLDEAIRLGVHPAVAKQFESQIALAEGDLKAAFDRMDEAVRLGADWPPHIANWLNMAFSLGMSAKAQPAFEKFYAENPDFIEARIMKAELLAASKDFQGALAEARKATAIAPYNVRAMIAEAAALAALGRHAEALEIVGRTLKLMPDNYRAKHLRVQCLASLGRFDDARAAAAELEKSHPGRAAEIERLRQLISQSEAAGWR